MAEKTQIELAQLNPTEYVFEASWKDVKTAARKYLGNGRYRGLILTGFGLDARGEAYKPPLPTYLKEIENDYFTLSTSGFEVESFSYRWFGCHGSGTILNMEIHLDSLGLQRTRVRVLMKNYRMKTGFVLGSGHGYVGPVYESAKVTPTMVEEYQVLYKIGKGLGVADRMPRINYPVGLTRQELEDTYYNHGNRFSRKEPFPGAFDELDEL